MESEVVTQLAVIGCTEKHSDIKKQFIKRVRAYLDGDMEIKTYGIDFDHWRNSEVMKLMVSESIELEISLRFKK